MSFIYKYLIYGLIACAPFVSRAAMEWPPQKTTPAAQDKYFQEILEAYPWTATLHSNFVHFYQGALAAQHAMKELPGAVELIEARPQLIRFKIMRVIMTDVKGYGLTPAIQNQLSYAHVHGHHKNTEYLQNSISAQLNQKGRFQGALTAVLRYARKISKEVFSIGDPHQQLHMLIVNQEAIDDEELLENFRFEEYGLKKQPSSLKDIFDLMSLMKDVETTASSALLGLLLQNKNSGEVQLNYESLQDFKEEAESALDKLGVPDSKARSALIDQTARLSFGESMVKMNSKSFEPVYEVQELAVFPALFRGCVGGDCSSTTSYIYPASPAERVFLLKAFGSGPVGYISGTTVTVNDKPAFYLRDLAVPNLASHQVGVILAGFYNIQKELGVDQIVLATQTVLGRLSHNNYAIREIGAWSDKMQSRIVYNPVDVQIRNQILDGMHGSSQSYDAVSSHIIGHLMVKQAAVDAIQVEFLDNSGKELLPPEKIGKSELQSALQIGVMDPALAKRRVHPDQFASFEILCHALANRDQVTLEQFYKNIEEALKPFDIRLSQKLIHDWSNIIAHGHLRSSNAMTSSDEAWARHTVDFALELILRTTDAEDAYQLIAKNVKAFETSEKFLKMLSAQLNPADPENPPRTSIERLKHLRKAGIVFQRALELSEAEVELLAQNGFAEIKMERLKLRINSLTKKKNLTEEELIEVSGLLDNEKMEDDGPSLWALNILAQHKPKNEQIHKEIYRTFRNDENPLLYIPAAFLFLELSNEETEAKYVERAVKKLLKHKDDKELTNAQRKQIVEIEKQFEKVKAKKKEDAECEAALTGGKLELAKNKRTQK